MTELATSPILTCLRSAISSAFRGDPATIDLLLCAWLAGGHALIEDRPGVGKTTLARALAQAIGGRLTRIQCTPDLTPADITGVSIWDEHERAFVFHPGPVFGDVLLADELNRTPPRTQSALLEAMSEGQVTADGVSRALSATFLCIATQNPLDHAGTYLLPDSQRDRFLLAFALGYPSREHEDSLLIDDGAEQALAAISPGCSAEQATSLRAQTRTIRVHDQVRAYILDIIDASRHDDALLNGASPRAALGFQRVCQAHALLAGRDYVIPADVQDLAVAALAHRVTPRLGRDSADIIRDLIDRLPAPR
ncbi:MAG: AAA family ATPase [Planctomycetota bacterium]|jgi:MoxR-like ATPase